MFKHFFMCVGIHIVPVYFALGIWTGGRNYTVMNKCMLMNKSPIMICMKKKKTGCKRIISWEAMLETVILWYFDYINIFWPQQTNIFTGCFGLWWSTIKLSLVPPKKEKRLISSEVQYCSQNSYIFWLSKSKPVTLTLKTVTQFFCMALCPHNAAPAYQVWL